MYKFAPVTIALPALALAACAPVEEIAFTSKQEEACYNQASAQLGPNRRLERDRIGVFVEVFATDGFTRSISPSAEFDACMVQNQAAGSGGDLGTITFTPEEQKIWDSLTDAARKDALEFIRNGGTLKEFVAQ